MKSIIEKFYEYANIPLTLQNNTYTTTNTDIVIEFNTYDRGLDANIIDGNNNKLKSLGWNIEYNTIEKIFESFLND